MCWPDVDVLVFSKGYKFKKKKKKSDPHLTPYVGLGRHSLVVSKHPGFGSDP